MTKAVFYHPESDCYYSGSLEAAECVTVDAHTLPAGARVAVGCGYSTALPDLDFETYSEAGYEWDDEANKWGKLGGKSSKGGISVVGAAVYAEHPTTEVLSLSYNLKDGLGARLWLPGMPPPVDLFNHIKAGGLLEAANSAFEYYIWLHVCHKRMGWPELPIVQLRDALAKARAHSIPGQLGKAAKVIDAGVEKIEDGKRLIQKLSVPRNPTARDPRRRLHPYDPDVAADAAAFYAYNIGDIVAESTISAHIPDLSPSELELWLLDQRINARGVSIDREAVANCSAIISQASSKYTAELVTLTGGAVQSPGEISKLTAWLQSQGVRLSGLTSDDVAAALKRDDIPPHARRVLEIRDSLGAASVKKLDAIALRTSSDGRLRDILLYCGADRTGRWAGRGPQPQNLPNSGPRVKRCECGRHYRPDATACPWCSLPADRGASVEWGIEAVEDALEVFKYRRLDIVERVFGDAVAAVSGCLRGLFSAAPGHDLLCSDYSAIEAVVLAALAGEDWRLEVFRTHGKIYEMSAAKITGIPFDDFLKHKKETGDHHPMRKKVGKVAELASGYQGGVGAWKNFGADAFMTDDEIKENIKKWRAESPAIVNFWAGLEQAAINAVKYPGTCFAYRGITYGVKDDVLYCRLLSGRFLSYHNPRLHDDVTPWGEKVDKLTFMGSDSITKQWVRIDTYGGKLCENVVQATARDILAHALVLLDRAGYMPVLHIHDEVVVEVPEGTGDINELEAIMATMPEWARDWPIRAAGGWRGKRYRKD